MKKDHDSSSSGIQIIGKTTTFLQNKPGIYHMKGSQGKTLYIGKAKNLKKRVKSYLRQNQLSIRMQRMISLIKSIETVTTNSEAEALLLESNLIKKLKPPFNILLRDDKSFPYILIRNDHKWPQLLKYRGQRIKKGHYFGPFPSTKDVNETIVTLEKAFLLRTCTDNNFKNRQRPCLLHQIKRCSAPCVNLISHKEYSSLVKETVSFLSGKNQTIQEKLGIAMQSASENKEYEKAAVYRDRIKALRQVQILRRSSIDEIEDIDILAGLQKGGITCIQVSFFRDGSNYGSRSYFPKHGSDEKVEDVLAAFIPLFYASHPIPKKIYVNHKLQDPRLLEQAMKIRKGKKIHLMFPRKGEKRNMILRLEDEAKEAFAKKLSRIESNKISLKRIVEIFRLGKTPRRIEVYDNSHIAGSEPVGGMIVANEEGFVKKEYRKYNIGKITPLLKQRTSDDYAMIKEVLTRRFKRILNEDPDRASKSWPDLILIDGGKGHLSVALKTLRNLKIKNIPMVAMAKGLKRNEGKERFFSSNGKTFSLDPKSPTLYYLQRLRDEAHRFAITSHRQKRSKSLYKSELDKISGVGSKRKKILLQYFGSLQGISEAKILDLKKINGINRKTAEMIFNHFHDHV
ncbi:MAG: excinuclease ABC subunit UvrC [Pseudomonadota bacterium]|nr:excinuclease ABC subunit UvrC [Pseudomonadota bacterium]